MPKTPPPLETANVDLLVVARFLVLPRAVELLEAFAAIPPGRLRDTIVEHAQALAEAHSNAPAQYRQPDPLPAALGHPGGPRALPRRTDAKPPVSEPKTKAVQMRLDGAQTWQIAEATGLKIGAVYEAITEARAAGVQFPKIARSKPGTFKRQMGFVMTVEGLTDAKAIATSGRAADARGIDLRAYMERRKTAIEMALDGRHIRAIMEATKESKPTLTAWFTTARAAGYPVPYMMDAMITHVEDRNVAPAVVNLGRERQKRTQQRKQGVFIMSEEDVGVSGLALVDKAAASLGVSRAGYFNLRTKAVSLFEAGKHPAEVSRTLGLSKKQAENWRVRAIEAGVLRVQA